MSVPGKKGRDLSQLPTLSYEVKLNLPTSTDSNPQEISFLDLVANDNKFKNDKDSLELVLSSYVKACGKQSVKEILAERDNIMEDNASLSDVIRALMDYNDQQNANLGVGYNDPDDDDSFIDDSTAAQDIIPKNMTNERDGFYVNEKHQPIQAKYLSESSDSELDDEEDESDESGDDDEDDDDDRSSASEKDDKQMKKVVNPNTTELNEKIVKKPKIDESLSAKVSNTKRKRSISEVSAPPLSMNLDEKNKTVKPIDEQVKKVKKLSETTGEICAQNFLSNVLPAEMDADIKPCIDKLVRLISLDQSITHIPKKIERLYEKSLCRELLNLVKKLHRHTNAHRQLVFDLLGAKTGVAAPILITRGRLLLLNDYEPTAASMSMKDLKDKLKIEINRSLEFHIQAHNQAIKEWQQKLSENPSKDKNRGPRKNFRFHKTINELIIRCVDRQLETMSISDSESLESFLHDHIVPLWSQSGWMTAKKILSEVIRIEYRPLRDPSAPAPTIQAARVVPTIDRTKKDAPIIVPASATKILNQSSTITNNAPKVAQTQNSKANEIKSSANSQAKLLEMATRVSAPNPIKQPTTSPSSSAAINQIPEQLYSKSSKNEVIRPIAKPAVITSSTQPESTSKRHSTPNISTSAVDLSIDLYSQYKKHLVETSKVTPSSSSNKDPSSSISSQRSTTSVQSTKQSQQQQQQQFATKLPSEKTPAGSFLKDPLSSSSSPKISASSSSPKISSLPLTVDSLINKSLQSPTSNHQRSSSSQKVATTSSTTNSTNRSSNDPSHHRTDQHHKASSSSNRPSSNSSSSSSRRSTPAGFSSSHDQQSSRSHSSQVTIPSGLSQALQWDPTTLQLAAAALANPQLLNSPVFDPALFTSMFASAANMVPSSQSPTSSRQQHSQNINNNRRT